MQITYTPENQYNALNAEIMMDIETDDIINELFESILEK